MEDDLDPTECDLVSLKELFSLDVSAIEQCSKTPPCVLDPESALWINEQLGVKAGDPGFAQVHIAAFVASDPDIRLAEINGLFCLMAYSDIQLRHVMLLPLGSA